MPKSDAFTQPSRLMPYPSATMSTRDDALTRISTTRPSSPADCSSCGGAAGVVRQTVGMIQEATQNRRLAKTIQELTPVPSG